MQEFLARINGNEKQLLSEHLNNVAELSAGISDYKNISKLAGILHDFGKAKDDFQNYLLKGGKKGTVIHSFQGAFFIDDAECGADDVIYILLREILASVIISHHNHLNDGISPDGETTFAQKLDNKDDEKYHYQEVKQNITSVFPELDKNLNELINTAKTEIKTILNLIQTTYKSRKSCQFALGFLVKYIYSCLIDADRLDAYLFDVNEKYRPKTMDWDESINIFEEKIQNFGNEDKISRIRQSVSNQCRKAAGKVTGIYQLSVPTGGGKTLSSLRFALHHCKKENKKRIIYVIPYLSIIGQTAANLREILNLQKNSGVLLEHHSNIVPPDNIVSPGNNEDEKEIRKLMTSRWDSPIIITTMVQFLETVMSSRGGDLRKFHNMSDAVIIFDEIQSLPIKSIHIFNEAVSFLAKCCNTTILLCTATQPLLDKTERKNLLLENNPDLIDCKELFKGLNRTRIVAVEEKNADGFADFISEKADINGNCLAIVNVKKSAREIFNRLKDKKEFKVYHLSTSMCPKHREKTIKEIITSLKNNIKVICIATQLIEAGIDISFACAVRAAAGLDSVMQAAGRCNRNGEYPELKEVYVIPLKDENLDKLPDIKSGKEITERLIYENKGEDLSKPEIMDKFYKYYFYDRRNLMDYPTNDGKTVYDMLSVNEAGAQNYRNRTGNDCHCFITHAFHTADEEFYVIDKNTESVVVYYEESEKLIETYRNLQPKNIITKEKIDIIKELERFSVSLYSYEMQNLAGAIQTIDDETGIKILDKNYYDKDAGVIFQTDPKNFII